MRIIDMIQAIRGTAGELNVAVLDSVLDAVDANTATAAASQVSLLARRIATATDALDRQFEADGQA